MTLSKFLFCFCNLFFIFIIRTRCVQRSFRLVLYLPRLKWKLKEIIYFKLDTSAFNTLIPESCFWLKHLKYLFWYGAELRRRRYFFICHPTSSNVSRKMNLLLRKLEKVKRINGGACYTCIILRFSEKGKSKTIETANQKVSRIDIRYSKHSYFYCSIALWIKWTSSNVLEKRQFFKN